MKNRLGIVGGGQLARMLTFEAKQLGFTVVVVDPTPRSPAGQVAEEQIDAQYDNAAAIKKLANLADFVTFDIESADSRALEALQKMGVQVSPAPRTLAMVKDKLGQKRYLLSKGIPVADFGEVSSVEDIAAAAETFGYPIMLKSRFGAYDGRGNAVIQTHEDILPAFTKLGGRDLYVERIISFTAEVAVMVARGHGGKLAIYPAVETVHRHNICHTVYAPPRIKNGIDAKAEALARKVAGVLEGEGVFGIEMFVTLAGEVLVNEVAPRVHNSGHHTIESSATSQFQQHIRAISGLPLGSTALKTPAVMINILGERSGPVEVFGLAKALAIPGVSVHIYGKADTRLQRKMGHITAIAKTLKQAEANALAARKAIRI